MADEENPLGGGTPFGVGPFGPLIPTAAVAVAAFGMVVVTTAVPLNRTLYYQANIIPPPTAALAAAAFEPAPGKWMPRWQGPPKYQPNRGPFAALPPPTAVVEAAAAAATPDKWLQRWWGPPKYQPNRGPFAAYLVSEPPAAPVVVDTINAAVSTTTGAVRSKTLFYQSVAYPVVYQAAVADNTGTVTTWLVPLSRAAPRPPVFAAVYTPFVPKEATRENTQTPDKWMARWPSAVPHVWPIKQLAPFVPREAVLDNTVTPDAWMPRWQAAKTPKPIHTQPFYGYPYVAASNLTTTLEWMVAWQGPPRYLPPKIAAQPFIPKEAVLENTVTPDKWLVRFAKAVPVPKPVPSQPVFGYPYESLAIVVPYEQWWHQPLSRAPARPAVHAKPYQPFVPKEAVLENTVTPDKWLQRFAKAVPTPKPVPTQPAFVYPGERSNLTTSIEWLQKWQGPPRYRPRSEPFQPFVPKAAVVDRVTPDKWLMRWQGPPRYTPIKVQTPPFVPREATAENTVTPEKWIYRFQKAVPGRPVTHTQPFYGYPYADQFIIGGPADEPERVVCVLAASRVAVEPELLRDAIVPVSLRTATVPELSRVVVTLDSSEVVDSNRYRDEPCPPFGNVAGIPVVGGDVTPEPSEGDFILLESGDAVLLEDGDHILLEGETSAPQEDTLVLEEGGDQLLLESGDDILLED